MNQDDLIIQREVRRLLEKRPVDASLAVVTHSKGYITVTGQIRANRSLPFVNLQNEVAEFQKQVLRSMSNIKSVSIDGRVIPLPKKQKHEVIETTTGIPGSRTKV